MTAPNFGPVKTPGAFFSHYLLGVDHDTLIGQIHENTLFLSMREFFAPKGGEGISPAGLQSLSWAAIGVHLLRAFSPYTVLDWLAEVHTVFSTQDVKGVISPVPWAPAYLTPEQENSLWGRLGVLSNPKTYPFLEHMGVGAVDIPSGEVVHLTAMGLPEEWWLIAIDREELTEMVELVACLSEDVGTPHYRAIPKAFKEDDPGKNNGLLLLLKKEALAPYKPYRSVQTVVPAVWRVVSRALFGGLIQFPVYSLFQYAAYLFLFEDSEGNSLSGQELGNRLYPKHIQSLPIRLIYQKRVEGGPPSYLLAGVIHELGVATTFGKEPKPSGGGRLGSCTVWDVQAYAESSK